MIHIVQYYTMSMCAFDFEQLCGVFTYIYISKWKEAFWLVQVLMLSSNHPPL